MYPWVCHPTPTLFHTHPSKSGVAITPLKPFSSQQYKSPVATSTQQTVPLLFTFTHGVSPQECSLPTISFSLVSLLVPSGRFFGSTVVGRFPTLDTSPIIPPSHSSSWPVHAKTFPAGLSVHWMLDCWPTVLVSIVLKDIVDAQYTFNELWRRHGRKVISLLLHYLMSFICWRNPQVVARVENHWSTLSRRQLISHPPWLTAFFQMPSTLNPQQHPSFQKEWKLIHTET